MRLEKRNISVTLTNDTCVIRRSGRSAVSIAAILGIERCNVTNVETVWLDRIVHLPDEQVFEDENIKWEVSGAVSTKLRRSLNTQTT